MLVPPISRFEYMASVICRRAPRISTRPSVSRPKLAVHPLPNNRFAVGCHQTEFAKCPFGNAVARLPKSGRKLPTTAHYNIAMHHSNVGAPQMENVMENKLLPMGQTLVYPSPSAATVR